MSDVKSSCEEIYRELKLDEYRPYANIDGLNELLSKSFWPELESMDIQINNVDEFLESNSKETVEALFGIFKDKNDEWQGKFRIFIHK